MFKFDETIFAESEIAAPAETVWKQIAWPGGVTRWHPFVKENITERWNGLGSKDKVTYFSGRSFEREVVHWVEGSGYDLKLTENGKNEALAAYRITPINENGCKFQVTVHIKFMNFKFLNTLFYCLLDKRKTSGSMRMLTITGSKVKIGCKFPINETIKSGEIFFISIFNFITL